MRNNKEWAEELLEKIICKMDKVSERSADKIPYSAVGKVHDDWSGPDKIGWWTNGFWGGIMWQLYSATGDDKYKKIAIKNEKLLDANLMNYMMLDHDNGFKWLPTAVAHYQVDKDVAAKNRGILAANNLAGRFNPEGNFIRAWNGERKVRGWAIIDCMMNLPLLYWASEETEDPRFKNIAVRHAKTVQRHFVREDGSVNHIMEFDAETGEVVKAYGGQGMKEGSSWTRGQAWGLYGFTLSYIHTGKKEFLSTAMKIAAYFISKIPANGVIPVDFQQPCDVKWSDSTAAAIAACGLIELSDKVGQKEQAVYLDAAIKLLKSLEKNDLNLDLDTDYLLAKCSAAYNDDRHEFPIIYGDYYFIEAINKLAEKELFIW